MKIQRLFFFFSNLALIIPLFLYSYHGLYSRYLADDFCTSAQLKSLGFFQSMEAWRLTWSGRYSFYFFMNLTHLIGQWLTPYMTALTVLAWLAALFVLARQIFGVTHRKVSGALPLFLALVVLFAVLDGTPDRYQALYWHTGVVTYIFPLVILTLYSAYFLYAISKERETPWWEVLLSAAVLFVAGGFSETYVAFQITVVAAYLFLVLLFLRGSRRRTGLILASAGLVGAVSALILVMTAPGNSIRLSMMSDHMKGFELVYWTLRHSIAFTKNSLYNAPFSALLALIAPGVLIGFLPSVNDAQPEEPRLARFQAALLLLAVPLLAFLLIGSTITPSLYATNAYPAERALITAQFALILAVALWSGILGFSLRPYLRRFSFGFAPAAILVGLLLLPAVLFSSRETLANIPEVQGYARSWDKRDRDLRAAANGGVTEIAAPSLPHMSPGLAELSEDREFWVNQCFATHYGLFRVSGR